MWGLLEHKALLAVSKYTPPHTVTFQVGFKRFTWREAKGRVLLALTDHRALCGVHHSTSAKSLSASFLVGCLAIKKPEGIHCKGAKGC